MRALVLVALLLAAPAHADRIKDISRFAGPRSNQLTGYGLVVGLAGGGDENLEYTVQSIKSAAARLGVSLPFGVAPGLKNAAAVMITADLPAFAKPGQRIDVTVSAFGKAKSLRGGTLLMAPLAGADGEIYALAQGSLAVAGFGAEGKDGSKVVVNTPTSGRIPGGASVEREVANPFGAGNALVLNLNESDFTTAQTMAQTINAATGSALAAPVDAMSVRIVAPVDPAARIALASFIENLEVVSAVPAARIVVNARTGTIVIGGNVRVLPTAVAHGSLTVRITENDGVSQPAPFSNGTTERVAQSSVEASEDRGHMQVFAPGVALSDLVDAVNALGAA
ncbi:MAG: flagellar basal body P-ring protein FlgI, partial [Polymorphobacter sp.]